MKNLANGISREKLVRLLIDNTPVAYVILDEEYRIHYINENFIKLRNLDPVSSMGERCYNISNGGKRCRQCAVAKAFQTGEKAFIARKDTLPDGSVRFIDDYAIPLHASKEGGRKFVLEIMVNRTQEMLARERRNSDYDEILAILSSLLEAKDQYTATHSGAVRKVAIQLALAMGLGQQDVFDISVAASLHDIGKVHIPDRIINKPDKLTDEEFAIIKSHPTMSYDMLYGLSSFDTIKNIVRHHHERVDGRGYPDGITGSEMSLGTKIVAVADTYDAITSSRSYRKALSHRYAMDEITRVAGTQLDAEVVGAFLEMDFDEEREANRVLDSDSPPVERVIEKQVVVSKEEEKGQNAFKRIVDEDLLLDELFENTPCGYVLMDADRRVLFASKYFLNYMGLTEEETVGKLCYKAGTAEGVPCVPCAIERSLASGKVEHMRQEQETRNGRKIFDLFGMPLPGDDGEVEYVIEIIIDRTDEMMLEREHEQDFASLINMLNNLLKAQDDSMEPNENMSADILALRERLNELMKK